MGCGDAATMCEQVAREDVAYRSEAACFAESEAALIRESNQPYPLLMAECRPVSGQIASFWGGAES
ncbi:MAG: hypothetical protein AAGE05_08635 [Pseudomonadota bacterium]